MQLGKAPGLARTFAPGAQWGFVVEPVWAFVRIVVLLLVASLAGCVGSHAGAEPPIIWVNVVDASGEDAYRGDYEPNGGRPLRFVPTLLGGSLDAVDRVWIITREVDFMVNTPLFVDGQLTEAEVFMGIPGAHFWYLEIEVDGVVHHPPDQRFWIATEDELDAWTGNFTAGILPGEEPECGGPEPIGGLAAGNRRSQAHWTLGDLFGAWSQVEPNPLDSAVIELTFTVQGEAELLSCKSAGQSAPPAMQQVGPGQWRMALNASALQAGGGQPEVHIEIVSTAFDNQVTVELVPQFPQGRLP